MGVFSSGGVGIDLGSANVTIFLESEGVVLREPSYVLASRDDPDNVLACGRDARQTAGKNVQRDAVLRRRPDFPDGGAQRFPQADGEPFARIFGFAVVCHRRTSYFFLYSSARPRLPSGSKWPVRSSSLTVIPAIIGVTRAAAANSAAVKTDGSDSGRNRP